MAVIYRLFDTERQWDQAIADIDRRGVETIVPQIKDGKEGAWAPVIRSKKAKGWTYGPER